MFNNDVPPVDILNNQILIFLDYYNATSKNSDLWFKISIEFVKNYIVIYFTECLQYIHKSRFRAYV